MSLDPAGLLFVEQLAQHRQVVLLVVDGISGPRRRRPGQHGVTRLARMPLELFEVRDAARRGAHDVERIEGRHTRARFTQLDSRIRHIQTLGRGARRRSAAAAARRTADGSASAATASTAARRSSSMSASSRGFCGNIRSASPGTNTTRNAAATRLMRRTDEHAAVAARGWIRVEQQQTLGKDAARFIEIDRADVGHRPQIGEHAQHLRRCPQRARHRAPRTDRATFPTALRAATPASVSMIGSANARR